MVPITLTCGTDTYLPPTPSPFRIGMQGCLGAGDFPVMKKQGPSMLTVGHVCGRCAVDSGRTQSAKGKDKDEATGFAYLAARIKWVRDTMSKRTLSVALVSNTGRKLIRGHRRNAQVW